MGHPAPKTVILNQANFSHWVSLLKPRVMSLAIFSALCGYILYSLHGGVSLTTESFFLGMISIFAIALGAGGAGALNMAWEVETDRKMSRTCRRPGPMNLISGEDIFVFGTGFSLCGVGLLTLSAGLIPAFLLCLSILHYSVIYTIVLKPRTPHSISIGGIAGALPPLIGWSAAGGSLLDLQPWLLFLLIALWTPPHFWALGLLAKDDYKQAGFPIHPVYYGVLPTVRAIRDYSIAMVALTYVPIVLGWQSAWLTVLITPINAYYIWHLIALIRNPHSSVLTRRLFLVSILYLFVILTVIVIVATVQALLLS